MGTKAYDNFADLITFSRVSGGTALRHVGYGDELGSDVATDWAAFNGGSVAQDGEWVLITGAGASGTGASLEIPTVQGKLYRWTMEFDLLTSSLADAQLTLGPSGGGDAFSPSSYVFGNTDRTITYTGVCTDATSPSYIYVAPRGAGLTCRVRNISVKEVIFDRASDPLVLFNHPANIPRIEYAADGTRKGLLIEEQRTNLLTYSEQFDNAAWVKTQSSVDPDATTAPDGTQTADKFEDAVTGNNYAQIRKVASATSSGLAYTWTVYAKAEEHTFIHLNIEAGTYVGGVYFNLSTGQKGTEIGGATGEIVPSGSGWYRCSVSFVANTAHNLAMYTSDSDSTIFATRAIGSGIYVWGAQLEAGAFPTSYIPTTGATATRSADVASIPVSAFGYNQGVGSLVVNANPLSATNTQYLVDINNDTTADEIGLLTTTSDRFRFILDPTGTSNDVDMTINGAEGAELFAAAWKLNNTNAAHGGVVGTTDTANTPIANAITLDIGTDANGQTPFSGHIKSIAYYPRRLSNAQLQELTA